jgi:Holliday junction resolvase RusA-like endonuclease
MIIEIPGIPIAKTRARYRYTGSFVSTYDPQDKEKKQVMAFLQKFKPADFHQEYAIDINFFLPYPSVSKKAQNLISWGVVKKPSRKDLDNLVKFYLDCANGILFPDDCMIVNIKASKCYGKNPRTMINIESMATKKIDDQAQLILSQIPREEFLEMVKELNQLEEINLTDESLPYYLSKFADKYVDKLTLINRKCPGYWKKLPQEKIA